MEDNVKIIVDEEVKGFECTARRPHFRMRGKPVTPEQAFEIICRTDTYLVDLSEETGREWDFIYDINFNNWLIDRHHYPFGYGWIHADGTVGGNAITQKYPNAEEFIEEWSRNIKAFPYLDLVIAVTYWNEIPEDLWEFIGEPPDQRRDFQSSQYDDEFYDAIEVGIYVHDNTVEIMSPQRTREKYREYAARYEDQNREKYKSRYYHDRGIVQVNEAYVRRCLEYYGADPEKKMPRILSRLNN